MKKSNENVSTRVVCPIDNSHTVYKSRLKKHILICNKVKLKKIQEVQTFYSKYINGYGICSKKKNTEQFSFSYLEKLEALLLKICHNSSLDLETEISNVIHDVNDGITKRNKHAEQNKALTSLILAKTNLKLLPSTCFVELGASKGALSVHLYESLVALKQTKCSHVLIDRDAFNRKKDRHIQRENSDNWNRIRLDIRHLKLNGQKDFAKSMQRVICAKHLCGVATDFAINAAVNAVKLNDNLILVIALCCHHLCSKDTFNNEFLRKTGIDEDFENIIRLSSWATCNFNSEISSDTSTNFSNQRKKKLGQLCKKIINLGRVDKLTRQGFDVRLVKYIPEVYTLENIALIATSRKK